MRLSDSMPPWRQQVWARRTSSATPGVCPGRPPAGSCFWSSWPVGVPCLQCPSTSSWSRHGAYPGGRLASFTRSIPAPSRTLTAMVSATLKVRGHKPRWREGVWFGLMWGFRESLRLTSYVYDSFNAGETYHVQCIAFPNRFFSRHDLIKRHLDFRRHWDINLSL